MTALYMLNVNTPTHYFCPVEQVRETGKQIVVKTPKGREVKFWKKNMSEVGNANNYLRMGDMPPESDNVKLSGEAQAK